MIYQQEFHQNRKILHSLIKKGIILIHSHITNQFIYHFKTNQMFKLTKINISHQIRSQRRMQFSQHSHKLKLPFNILFIIISPFKLLMINSPLIIRQFLYPIQKSQMQRTHHITSILKYKPRINKPRKRHTFIHRKLIPSKESSDNSPTKLTDLIRLSILIPNILMMVTVTLCIFITYDMCCKGWLTLLLTMIETQ
jgi:hypothetical protein